MRRSPRVTRRRSSTRMPSAFSKLLRSRFATMAAKRQLGNSGLQFAPFALGGNVFGWTADERASFEVLDAFVAAGFNFIDTADAYSSWVPGHKGGESEEVIGKWMKSRGNRDKVLVATKFAVEVVPGE